MTTQTPLVLLLLSFALLTACQQAEELSPCETAQETVAACGLDANLSCELDSGEHDENYLRLSEQSCEQLRGESDPKADLLPSAPENWIALGPTSQSSVDWLYQFKDSGFFLFNNFEETLVYLFAGVGNHAHIIQMSREVTGASCVQKVLSAGAIVHNYVAGERSDYNCKHYAATLRAVLAHLGVQTDIEAGMTWDGGHAWTDVYCPGGIVSADAYNRIYVLIEDQ